MSFESEILTYLEQLIKVEVHETLKPFKQQAHTHLLQRPPGSQDMPMTCDDTIRWLCEQVVELKQQVMNLQKELLDGKRHGI